MSNVYVRIFSYVLAGVGIAVSAAGLADFDLTTGMFDLRPFNLYNVAGLVASVATPFLVFKRWGTK